MAKNKSFTGSRQSVGTPTLNKNNYMHLFRTIRKAREEKNAEAEKRKAKL